jgi:hypothetical protein
MTNTSNLLGERQSGKDQRSGGLGKIERQGVMLEEEEQELSPHDRDRRGKM